MKKFWKRDTEEKRVMIKTDRQTDRERERERQGETEKGEKTIT